MSQPVFSSCQESRTAALSEHSVKIHDSATARIIYIHPDIDIAYILAASGREFKKFLQNWCTPLSDRLAWIQSIAIEAGAFMLDTDIYIALELSGKELTLVLEKNAHSLTESTSKQFENPFYRTGTVGFVAPCAQNWDLRAWNFYLYHAQKMLESYQHMYSLSWVMPKSKVVAVRWGADTRGMDLDNYILEGPVGPY